MPPVIDENLCDLCGVCEDICPSDVLYVAGGKTGMVRFGDECQHCDLCRIECPRKAIKLAIPWNLLQTSLRR